ncbi:MAG: zinc ribbon domain-containing protein [Syntrophaceae bacterium]
MPTYEYACTVCGQHFEQFQAMSAPDPACPECGGAAQRRIVAGAGVITATGGARGHNPGGCSFETTGVTCCGSRQRCATPGCEK